MSDTYRFFIITADPVHVGTGGMRLGRVDNTIVREPGTNLPKIPGTALHGAIRMYAARRYGKSQCAGQKGHCGQPTCPICYTFGSIEGEAGSFSGVVSIGDARILLFPVYSMVGPVWVTSPTALLDAGFNGNYSVSDDKAKWNGLTDGNAINLGWLMLEKDTENGEWTPPDSLKQNLPNQIKDRIVLVSQKLFSQIVNSNLEVRTSVAINPETGAAEEGALYTYEAIPRATILWFDVIVDDFREAFPNEKRLSEWKDALEKKNDAAKQLVKKWHLWKEKDGDDEFEASIEKALKWVQDDLNKYGNNISLENAVQVVTAGLEWTEHLGIGGMGTRGFGRIRELACLRVKEHTLNGPCHEENAHGGTGSTGSSGDTGSKNDTEQ